MCDLNLLMSALPTLIFDVAIPFSDNISDLSLIIQWYIAGHWKYATGMLIPFLMNVLANFYKWWRMDSIKEKKYTWILVILQLWPVYRAIKLIRCIYKKDPQIEEKKRLFTQDIAGLEAFLESVPSLLVMFAVLIDANVISLFILDSTIIIREILMI